MSPEFVVSGHRFRITDDARVARPDGRRYTLSHAVPGMPGSSHSVGVVVAYKTEDEARAAAAHHAAVYADTGDCDGSIPVRTGPTGKIHLGWLDRNRTHCGILLGKPGAAYRVTTSLGYLAVDCGRCR